MCNKIMQGDFMQQKCTLFPERLKELREKEELSRQQLADILGVSRASLEYYEKGKRTPDIEVLYKLSEHFNVTADYLIGRTDKCGESTDVNAMCRYTGLSEKAVNILTNIKSKEDFIKIINFLIEETDYHGDIEKGIFMKLNLLDSMRDYFFYDYGKRESINDVLLVTSLGHIFTSVQQYEAAKEEVFEDWKSNTDLPEMRISRISKKEILDDVYTNRIIEQLKETKERFKRANNGND